MTLEPPQTLGYRRWQAIRARGFRHFVLVRGLLVWGGALTLLIGVVIPRIKGDPAHPLLAAAISLPVAGLWAAATWWLSERRYRASNHDHPPGRSQ